MNKNTQAGFITLAIITGLFVLTVLPKIVLAGVGLTVLAGGFVVLIFMAVRCLL